MSPALHGALVGGAAITALVSAAVMLAKNPRTTSVRVHAVYGGTVAWWLVSMALAASAESTGRAWDWARMAMLGIGMLPAVIFHVNAAVLGIARERRRSIGAYYALAAAVAMFCVVYPDVITEPRRFSWGYYPGLSVLGLIPAGLLLLVFAEVTRIYRAALRKYERGTLEHTRALVFHRGNFFTFLAVLDFLPAFGVPIYPPGFAIVAVMFLATMVGSLRYHLIEITPAVAAEQILETVPDGLLVTDRQGMVRLANPAAARLLGRPVEALLGRPMTAITADADLGRVLDARGERPPASEEVEFTAGDAVRRRVVITGTPIHRNKSRHVATVWLLHDLTEQRHAEDERNRLEGWIRQTQKMESLGVMAGGIAHDFNNILMAILGNTEIAQTKLSRGWPIQEELRTIVNSAESASELIDQLLTYAGRGAPVEEALDLNVLSREMADLMRSVISRKATLELDLEDGLPMILGDRGQIRQVILNLVTNASEALGETPGAIALRTRAANPGRQVLLEVLDSGCGMDEETKTRIFDPFFTTKFAGRGLGMATVLRIVEAHKGVITVHSERGAGTHVEVSFPAFASPAVIPAGDETGSSSDWRGSGTALLADDEGSVRMVVRRMLCAIGFDVTEACDGVEAVAAFRRQPAGYSLVVLDLTMPGMDGREAAATIREVAPAIPIVFISGHSSVQGMDAGDPRTTFLHKPFKLPALAARIRQVTV